MDSGDKKQIGFLDFPRELRDQIYQAAIMADPLVLKHEHTGSKIVEQSPLAAVCRQIGAGYAKALEGDRADLRLQ